METSGLCRCNIRGVGTGTLVLFPIRCITVSCKLSTFLIGVINDKAQCFFAVEMSCDFMDNLCYTILNIN